MNLVKKINNPIIKSYILHNKKYFKKINSEKKILVEFNSFQSTHIAFSYLSNVLAKKYNASIQPFFNYTLLSSPLKPNILDKIKWTISKNINFFNHGIYRSFGGLKCIKPSISSKNLHNGKINQKKLYTKIKSKNEILKIKYKNILIGDILYDTYLKSKNEPTIDINSDKFKKFSEEFFALCDYWIDYFEINKVEAVITSHSVYSYAIPLRVAINKNIKAYGCTSRHINKLTKNRLRMHANSNEYVEIFNKLNKDSQEKGIQKAKKTLDKRKKGYISTNAGFFGNVKISPFNSQKKEKEILDNKKIKVLILPHDFFDAVHIYGESIFPDFYEWLQFLGEYSRKNQKYDWYIKLRPDYKGKYVHYHDRTEKVIDGYLKFNPQIKKISNNYSLHQIKEDGIDFILTVHGTAALEFALIEGPIVINASKNNPHFQYNFSLSPINLSQYIETLDNLETIKKNKKKVNLMELYEYYYVRHFFNDKNWLINQNKVMENLKTWDNQFTDKFYSFWLDNFNEENHNHILKRIKKFLDSEYSNMNTEIE